MVPASAGARRICVGGFVKLPYLEPVTLLERDAELTALRQALERTSTGGGGAVALCGEAGAGKSALAAAAYADTGGVRVLRAVCDPLGTPRPLGPFRDLAGLLAIAPVLADTETALSGVCEAVYDALVPERTVLVIEDAHWIDAASVEVLRFVLRRIEAIPLTLVVTYRDDDIGPQHSARALLGDFAALDRASTLRLRPLTEAAVADLLTGTGREP